MKTGILELGRMGDILNILPLAKFLSAKGEDVSVIVGKHFADIMEGVSYAKAHVFQGGHLEVNRAVNETRKLFDRLLISQVYRPDYLPPANLQDKTSNFCEASYELAGYGEQFRRGFFDQIVIDKRNEQREDVLRRRVFKTRKPKKILINLHGHSSPFPPNLADWLVSRLFADVQKDAEIVNLANVRAEKFQDLLGLYDAATLLITIDTATLHLAGATNLPYIGLVTHKPTLWYGSHHRGNCVHRCRYGMVREHMPVMKRLVDGLCRAPVIEIKSSRPVLRHVFYHYPTTHPEVRRRQRLTQVTWRYNYCMGRFQPKAVTDDRLPRRFRDQLRTLPYIRDILDEGLEGAPNDQRIVFTNTDTCMNTDCYERLYNLPSDFYVGRRRDFARIEEPATPSEFSRGNKYCGGDMFVFPAKWWREVRMKFPDMLNGSEGWDYIFARMLLDAGASESHDKIYHEWHPSIWEDPKNRYTLSSQIYNRCLAKAWHIQRFGRVPGPETGLHN